MSNTRVCVQSVTVMRDGKPFSPAVGAPFDFTKDELADIERMNPDAITKQVTVDVTAAPKKAAEKKEDL